jgi:hypothetical protein
VLPEARLGKARRPRPLAFVGRVVVAMIALFAGLRIAPTLLRRTRAAELVPVAQIQHGAFTSDGDAIAYVEERDLVLRRGDELARVASDPSDCWPTRFLSFPALFIYPDHVHVLLLSSGDAACFASFEGAPKVTSLRRWLAGSRIVGQNDNGLIAIVGAAPAHTFVYSQTQLAELDLDANKLEMLADDRAHLATTNCALGRAGAEVRLVCSHLRAEGYSITTELDLRCVELAGQAAR